MKQLALAVFLLRKTRLVKFSASIRDILLFIFVTVIFSRCVYMLSSPITQDFHVRPKTIRSAADRVSPVKLKDTEPEFTADISG